MGSAPTLVPERLVLAHREATQKLLLNRREAAHVLGVSERTLFELTKSGEIPSVRLGDRSVRYSVTALETRIAELQAEAAK